MVKHGVPRRKSVLLTIIKRALRTIIELGPAWITSIGALIVALTGAGFFVWHGNKPGPSPTLSPTTSATKTVSVQPTDPSGSASASSSSTPSSSPSPSTSSSAAPGNGMLGGPQLGSYSIDLTESYSVHLTATQPSQADFNTSYQGDLVMYTGLYLGRLTTNDLFGMLSTGTKPTYQNCSTDTVFATQAVEAQTGLTFCMIETTQDLIAGVTVESVQSNYAVLDITTWQDSS